MTPEQIAEYAVSVMQSAASEEASHLSIDESVAFLDKVAAATIKKLKEMRDDIKHSEPWEEVKP